VQESEKERRSLRLVCFPEALAARPPPVVPTRPAHHDGRGSLRCRAPRPKSGPGSTVPLPLPAAVGAQYRQRQPVRRAGLGLEATRAPGSAAPEVTAPCPQQGAGPAQRARLAGKSYAAALYFLEGRLYNAQYPPCRGRALRVARPAALRVRRMSASRAS
jgi:hypothetical protein